MKGVVVYDTYYGNTKMVAEAIAEQIRADGHEVELRDVKMDYPTPPQGDFMFVGTPIRMGAATGKIKRFVKKLDMSAWKDKPIAVFTTVMLAPKESATEKQKKGYQKWAVNPGVKLMDMARSRGLNVVGNHLWVEVKDSKGPLVETGTEKAKQFAREIVQSVRR